MRKFLLSLILSMQGVFGMHTGCDFIDYIIKNGYQCKELSPQNVSDIKEFIKKTDFTQVENRELCDAFFGVAFTFLAREMDMKHDAAVFLKSTYDKFRIDHVNNDAVIQNIIFQCKDVTINNIEFEIRKQLQVPTLNTLSNRKNIKFSQQDILILKKRLIEEVWRGYIKKKEIHYAIIKDLDIDIVGNHLKTDDFFARFTIQQKEEFLEKFKKIKQINTSNTQ